MRLDEARGTFVEGIGRRAILVAVLLYVAPSHHRTSRNIVAPLSIDASEEKKTLAM